jgi:hypothetical protein
MGLMSTTNIQIDTLASVLEQLPSYAEVTLTGVRNDKPFVATLMARDYPREGRRFTSLTTGTEVFGVKGYLENFQDMVDGYRFDVSFGELQVSL